MGRISTIDLLVLTSSDQLLLKQEHFFLFYKTRYLIKEVNHTEQSPSIRVPWMINNWKQGKTMELTSITLKINLSLKWCKPHYLPCIFCTTRTILGPPFPIFDTTNLIKKTIETILQNLTLFVCYYLNHQLLYSVTE
jgi:hypothetical protein